MHARAALAPLLALALLPSSALSGDGQCGPAGESWLLAPMPTEGAVFPPTGATYPEGVAAVAGRLVVSGPANFGTAGNGSPSQLTIFDRHSGALLGEVPVQGENLDFEHALSELAAHGNDVYAPSTQLGVLRWRVTGNIGNIAQDQVSTPFCSVTGGFPCAADGSSCPADLRPGLPPLPNGIAVDADGTAFVTDSLQGVIWRIPAYAGVPAEPEVFFCSAALQGSGTDALSLFGANGIAIDGDDLYVAVSFGPFGAFGPTSAIYRLDKAAPTGLELVHSFDPVPVAPGIAIPPIADGLRLHPGGGLFVALAGQNALVELDISQTPAVEVARYAGTDPDFPFVNPATVDFSPDGGSAYVTNHAITRCLPGDPSPGCAAYDAAELFGVFEVCVD